MYELSFPDIADAAGWNRSSRTRFGSCCQEAVKGNGGKEGAKAGEEDIVEMEKA